MIATLIQYLWLLAHSDSGILFRLGGSTGPEGLYTIPASRFLRLDDHLITGFSDNASVRGGKTQIHVRKVGDKFDQWVSPEEFKQLVGTIAILSFLGQEEERRLGLLRRLNRTESLRLCGAEAWISVPFAA